MKELVVFKLGGELCIPEVLGQVAETIKRTRDDGKGCVVIHGGGPQIDGMLARLQIPKKMVAGRRITDSSTIEVATMVLAGSVNTTLVASLQASGISAVGLTCSDGGIAKVLKRAPLEVTLDDGERGVIDFEYVGEIREIDPTLIDLLLRSGMVPVIASLGADPGGRILNMNADTVASEIAASLKASLLVLLTKVGGVLREKDDPSSVIETLTREEIERLKSTGVIAGGMLPKVSAAVGALDRGVRRVRIGGVHSLPEGTEITSS